MMNRIIVTLLILLITTSHGKLAFAQMVDENIQLMIEAARKMEWFSPENRAYLLIKNETIETPIAVIFGYGSNKVGCDELVKKLSVPKSVGTFKCAPIY